MKQPNLGTREAIKASTSADISPQTRPQSGESNQSSVGQLA